MASAWSPDDDATLRRLHGLPGRSLTSIATEMGRSKATVSRHATDLGLSWDRSQVAAATQAKVLDAKARRAALEAGLLEDAARLREQLFAPTVVFNFGGKDNTYEQRHIDEPTFTDKLKIMQATGTAIDRALKLAQHDADGGAADARSLLERLADRLGVEGATQ